MLFKQALFTPTGGNRNYPQSGFERIVMTIAVHATAALAAALVFAAPLPASSQAARLLGETDGAAPNTVDTAGSAGPIVSPIHRKTGDLARAAREAAQSAVAGPVIAPSSAAPIPAADAAEPAADTAGTRAPLGNQPADSVTDTPASAPSPGVSVNRGSAFKARTKVRTLRA